MFKVIFLEEGILGVDSLSRIYLVENAEDFNGFIRILEEEAFHNPLNYFHQLDDLVHKHGIEIE